MLTGNIPQYKIHECLITYSTVKCSCHLNRGEGGDLIGKAIKFKLNPQNKYLGTKQIKWFFFILFI